MGGVNVSSDQFIALESPVGAVGMIIVSEDAFAAGIGSIPGPVSDIGNDGWFFWTSLAVTFDASGGNGGGAWFEFDSKGKRIVHQGQRVVIVAEGAAAPAVAGYALAGFIRLLAKFRS